MKRTALILVLTVLMALPNATLVLASGGAAGHPPRTTKTIGPAITATIVMDPHMRDVTFDKQKWDPVEQKYTDVVNKGGWASIHLRKGTLSSGAVFRLPETFMLKNGCDLTVRLPNPAGIDPLGDDLMRIRFIYAPSLDNKENYVTDWIPQEILKTMLLQLGQEYTEEAIPVITSVENATCTIDPYNPNPLNATPDPARPAGAGMLSFEAVIQFLVDAPDPNCKTCNP